VGNARNVEFSLRTDAAGCSCRMYCTVMMFVGYCGDVATRHYCLLIRVSAVRRGYCFVVVRVSAVTVESSNLVVGLHSDSIVVRSPCIELEILLHRMYILFAVLTALMFGNSHSLEWPIQLNMEMGFVSWAVDSLCRPGSLKQLQENDTIVSYSWSYVTGLV
jgi:hypothetical protein